MDSSSNTTCSQYDQRHSRPSTSKKESSHTRHQYNMKPIHHRRKKEYVEQQEEQPPSQHTASSTTTPPPPPPPAADPDLSADTHRYFAEARSTPIMYSTCSLHSSTSTSSASSLEYNNAGVKMTNSNGHQKADDNRSLCSAHSFTAAQQQQMEYLNNRPGSSMTTTHSSTRNQTFYFGTPLPPQKQQPYQYHDPTWYCGDESNTPPWQTPVTLSQSQQPSASGSKSAFLTRKKDMFLQSNANHRRRLSEGGTSIKSAFSTGRQTIKSWRQKRINLMMKQHQLPDFETKAFCEVCEKYIQTRIRYRNGSMVWLMSFILLLCTVVLFWVPFYVKYFKDVAHFCPGCGKQLGVSYRL
ncbi:uncharacterized protein ATC70_012855 [Mucor velutinosus]|uniref:LITAF domain-containing protein n=1 Tax=Mucor velutinosus TaxID=708070 RepID=A0AAN7HKR6_9FUNG|nr:hypothetical protein ATC70_012855 [Mucor velutinosus]